MLVNIFDIGIILLLIMFFIAGFKRGVMKEAVGLLGIIAVFILSYLLKGYIGNILCMICPFFKFKGSIEGLTILNIVLYQAIAFILVFSILLSVYALLLKVSKFLQKIVNLTIILWLPSKILGGIVSIIKGYIVLFAVFIVLLIPLKNEPVFYESAIINTMLYHTPILSNCTNTFTIAITEIYELGEDVSQNTISKNEANLKGLDIILKYNITNKNTIENLIKLHKLQDIQNVDQVLENY